MPPLASALLILLSSYLIGSLVFGILYSRIRGRDIRNADLPGGSGTYRQYGLWPAIIVTALDILKGVAAVLLARAIAPEFVWLATLGVTLGHCYPLYFKFDGGGGIAPFNGGFMAAAPLAATPTFILALLVIPVYKATLQPRLKINAIPFAAACMLIFGIVFSLIFHQGLAAFVAGAAVMVVRAVQMLRQPGRESSGLS
ncbi:glycerol-3-phosphate acyltransferase [Deinococcus sp. KNUC1210]|uniref:glycerol-3-phosphate acyltransferase n=1 Tax=Deinococcus sp. KNUC1210 TaxID=2917691 RepID=UPI001EF06D2E|nr:glycerol-3-phosphate acyltransferase [Deinococcus sp. KNUC1210]ULH14923.1 glycerol-3-phosphate acyltransferase [Deinococcus sp. KNUC1210]